MSERLGLRVTGRLALLTAAMRAAGARVGVEELLRAHRALAAVGPADRRGAYFALRAVLCSRREDVEAFDAAFAEWMAEVAPSDATGEPETLADVASLVLPRVAVPAEERPPAPADARARAAAGGLVRRGAAAREGLRRVHRGRAPAGAAPYGPARRVRPRRAAAGACVPPAAASGPPAGAPT